MVCRNRRLWQRWPLVLSALRGNAFLFVKKKRKQASSWFDYRNIRHQAAIWANLFPDEINRMGCLLKNFEANHEQYTSKIFHAFNEKFVN